MPSITQADTPAMPIARSSTEAEYKGLADVSAKVTWIVSLLRELGLHSGRPMTKHVEIDNHFVREKVALGDFVVIFVSTKDQLADIFTKPLPGPRFQAQRDKLNVTSSTSFQYHLVLEGVC